MSKQGKKEKNTTEIAVYVLLITWIVLLLLLIGIFVLRLQGYKNFTEWRNRNQIQEVLQPSVITGIPVKTATPVPEVTRTPKITPVSEATATPTEVPEHRITESSMPQIQGTIYSGVEEVDAKIRIVAEELFAKEEEECYADYHNGIFYSIVFQKEEQLLPLVFDLTTAEQVVGSDLIKETYFAIIKERLQSYVAEYFPETAGSEFVTYQQIYQVEDYQSIYLTNEQLVFYFKENVLTEHQGAFSYGVSLAEAEAFFYKDMNGNQRQTVIRELDPNTKMIALTFDDGPEEKVEEKLLKLLEKEDIRVSFFFLGERIGWYPDMPKKVYEAGHEVGSHTYSHTLDFSNLRAKELWSEVNRTNLLIAKATGYAPDYIRFPGGNSTKQTTQVPMVVVNWNVDSLDYQEKYNVNGAQIIYERVVNSSLLGDGAIILMHSIYEKTYEATAKLIPYLKEQGYVFVTLSELFYYKGLIPENGRVYYNGYGEP